MLWLLSRDPRLSNDAKDAIRTGTTVVFVSAVTAWEITIKKALGKLEAPSNYLEALERYRLTPLPITSEHALAVSDLPDHHRDPFDRLLIAQAQYEKLRLVTNDAKVQAYDVPILQT